MREADNLTTFMCQISWKSGSLNLLEPSGPHRACYRTALPFIYIYIYIYIYIFIYIYLYLYIHTYINQCNKLVKFEVHPRPGHEGPETEVLYCSSTVTLVLEGKGA